MRRLLMCLLALWGTLSTAFGDTYPSRRITVIVPNPPGAASDTSARIITESMSTRLGQPIVIENVAGAFGMIGAQRLTQSTPDGYTLCFCLDGQLMTLPADAAAFGKPLPYTTQDFTPIGRAFETIFVLVAHPSLRVSSWDGFVSRLRADQTITIGRANPTGLIATGILKSGSDGFVFSPVSFTGEPAAMTNLLGGHINALFATTGTVLEHVRSGQVVPIGVIGKHRSPLLPALTTLSEQGAKDFGTLSAWGGMFGPKGLSEAIVRRLHDALSSALAEKAVHEKLTAMGYFVAPSTPEELRRTIDGYPAITRFLKDSGISLRR